MLKNNWIHIPIFHDTKTYYIVGQAEADHKIPTD